VRFKQLRERRKMALQGATDNDKLNDLISKPYKEQACWFLNAFWNEHSAEAEKCWEYVNHCGALDLQKNAEGSGLDEVNAHRLLEKLGETMTVVSMRETLRKTGAISASDRPKLVPLIHYLLFKYNVDWRRLVNSKGDNSAEMKEAQAKLDAVSKAFDESDAKLQVSKKAEAEARTQEAAARAQEAPFKAALEEQQAAVDEVKAQENAYNKKTEDLKRKSEEGGVVAQNKAKNELAQHLAEDPLPLRKAKITLEVAVKKAEKARAPFEAATKQAEAARAAAEESLEQSRLRLQEAEDYLQEVKKRPGNPYGSIWFMERALEEKKKYLPERKGGKSK